MNSVDLSSLDKLVLLAAFSSGGVWLAPPWPRFGTAMAGLCHRAAMYAAMDTSRYHCIFFYTSLYSISYICSSFGYWFLRCLCCCCLLRLLCYLDAMPKPTAAILMLV
jgi:hypothetical protein